MVSYKERKERTKVFVLLKDNEIVGVYGNLKKMCDLANYDDFPSYWTLARLDKATAFPVEYKGGYKIDYVRLH